MSFRKIVEHFQYRRGTLSSFSRPLATHSPQPAEQNHDPHSLMKQDPIEICTSLWVKTFSSSNLTGFLSNFDLWLLAYQRSCAHATGTFPPRNAVHATYTLPTLRYTGSGANIVSEKGVGTLLSVTASLQQCIREFRRLQLVKGDKDPEPLPCNPMLYSGQAHTNFQMNKFLETMADWYGYADNRKKVVGFCAYVVRSTLAKLYAARYRLKSRAKVYGIASRNLSRPLRESSNNSAPEYSDLLRMGLVDAIEGVQFSHMSLIPSCDYTPFPRNWIPDERVLHEYIKLENPKFFCELLRSVEQKGLSLPQDEISQMVCDYKTLGVRYFQSNKDKEIKSELEEITE
ncbi:Putative mitochondrial protein ymf11 [Glycine soja]|nr:Putative mitochondrial protein ymf11 [Glycine soja]